MFKKFTFAAGISLLIFSSATNAASFALREQSITYLGNAYAGTASAIQDASTSYYNPAGMSYLARTQIVLSGAYNLPYIRLTKATATQSEGFAIAGSNRRPSAQQLIGGLNAVWRINKKLSLGLSVVQPFGLDTKYSANNIARLMATTSKITTVDISPTISYKFHNKFFLGAGLDVLNTSGTIASGVAWGTTSSEDNGFVTNYLGSSWRLGYHVGLLLKPFVNTKIGLVYFSSFSPSLSGDTYSSETQTFGNPTSSSSKLNLPDRVNFGMTQGFSRKLIAMAEVEWTHWSRLQNWNMNYNSSALPAKLPFNYQDSWRFSVGADYKFLSAWTVKGGLAYDQSPTNGQFRSAMLPDSDAYMLGVGLKYAPFKCLSIVAAYSYVFYNNASIAQKGIDYALNSSTLASNLSALYGQYKNHADIFGLQLVLSVM